ncbi:carboxylesterase/lipase family protein [Aureibacillus halotolerans]|uniref:Carboxylic ester hydrolase n=1 Tax=Aureibacillus halotolerans TaxID=1508390 RepID=A0A4R6TQ07_9BACI|nr:carboxylesterase/lipase family protein [Aureibacillus halotolerans]TDQ34587.1 para-nitrobenzyl esterase [Aureibacillus halotolerans]
MRESIVHTSLGALEGTHEHGAFVWKGIPYAEPPTENLRFKSPVPVKAWEGVRKEQSFGPVCPQYVNDSMVAQDPKVLDQSEDCLYLTIWTPEAPSEKPLPVVVWIHGGAFVGGHSSNPLYHGNALAKRGNVIVVSFNYRLGALGFLNLSHLDAAYTPNAGLLDQVEALNWVQSHIASFGGDPANVTIMGESAGSMSVAALLAMPAAKGLFSKAIMQSGASQAMPLQLSKQVTSYFLTQIGADTPDSLANVSVSDLVAAQGKVADITGPLLTFQPVIDGNVLPLEPQQAIADGAAKDIPLLLGTNQDEGAFFIREDNLLEEQEIVRILATEMPEPQAEVVAKKYSSSHASQAQFITDLYFWRTSLQFIEAQSHFAPVWMYRFDGYIQGHPLFGEPVHAAEIPFVFGQLGVFQQLGFPITEEAMALSSRMQDAWLAFIQQGSPSTAALNWGGYTTETRATMVFAEPTTHHVFDPDAEKRAALMRGWV